MITCKEDLYGTEFLIESKDESILLEAKCIELGIKKAGWSGCNYENGVMFGLISKDLSTPHSKKLLFTRKVGHGDTMAEFLNLKRLTLEDLKSQTKEVEWVNGLPPVGVECEFKYKVLSDADWKYCKVFAYDDTVAAIWYENGDGELKHATVEVESYEFRKPETEEQKLERERMENGKSLYELVQKIWTDVDSTCTAHPYDSGLVNDNVKEMYARLAIETKYKAKGE
ncbi:putative coil containing protein [Vibrio phage 249E41-1]|nr:putative coil containing protein [Vibrio phage 249E41-1]